MSWGPFVPSLDPGERKARLRSLRAIVKVLTGPRGSDVAFAILRAELNEDGETLDAAAKAFDRLAALDRRRVLSNFAGLHTPSLRVVRNG